MGDIPWQIRSRPRFQERRKLRPDGRGTRRKRLEGGRCAAASLEVTPESLRDTGSVCSLSLRKTERRTGLPQRQGDPAGEIPAPASTVDAGGAGAAPVAIGHAVTMPRTA